MPPAAPHCAPTCLLLLSLRLCIINAQVAGLQEGGFLFPVGQQLHNNDTVFQRAQPTDRSPLPLQRQQPPPKATLKVHDTELLIVQQFQTEVYGHRPPIKRLRVLTAPQERLVWPGLKAGERDRLGEPPDCECAVQSIEKATVL